MKLDFPAALEPITTLNRDNPISMSEKLLKFSTWMRWIAIQTPHVIVTLQQKEDIGRTGFYQNGNFLKGYPKASGIEYEDRIVKIPGKGYPDETGTEQRCGGNGKTVQLNDRAKQHRPEQKYRHEAKERGMKAKKEKRPPDIYEELKHKKDQADLHVLVF